MKTLVRSIVFLLWSGLAAESAAADMLVGRLASIDSLSARGLATGVHFGSRRPFDEARIPSPR